MLIQIDIKTVYMLLLVIQGVRYLLFDHGLLQPLWRKFDNTPVIGTFLKCAFCQGFWLGMIVYLITLPWYFAIAWSLVSAWVSTIFYSLVTRRGYKGEEADDSNDLYADEVCLLECNIDDMSGEFFGDVMSKLFDVGAIDVWFTSAYGKKNRPLYQLSAMVELKDEEITIRTILAHSSTAGIRRRSVSRIVMQRDFVIVNVLGQNISVKRLQWQDIVKHTPEWEDCARVAKLLDKSVAEVYSLAQATAKGANS